MTASPLLQHAFCPMDGHNIIIPNFKLSWRAMEQSTCARNTTLRALWGVKQAVVMSLFAGHLVALTVFNAETILPGGAYVVLIPNSQLFLEVASMHFHVSERQRTHEEKERPETERFKDTYICMFVKRNIQMYVFVYVDSS